MKAIKFAILGFGGAGRAHAKRLQAINGAEVKVIYDPKPSALSHATKNYPDTRFTDNLDELFLEKIDAVSICTPDHTHFEYAKLSVQSGLHTLVEKPMFVTERQCVEMESILKESNVTFGVHHQMRYIPAFMAAHELVQEGSLGEIVAIESDYIHDMRQRASAYDDWRINHENPQNIVLGALSHTIDLMRWIVNEEVEDIFSFAGHKGWEKYPDVDTVIASLRFKSGILGKGTVTISSSGPQRNTIAVYGTKGQIHNNIYRNASGKIFLTTEAKSGKYHNNWSLKKSSGNLENEKMGSSPHFGISYGNWPKNLTQLNRCLKKLLIRSLKTPSIPLKRLLIKKLSFRDYPFSIYKHDMACEELLKDFIEAVRGSKKFQVDFSEGRAAVEACLHCIESYKTQKVVHRAIKKK